MKALAILLFVFIFFTGIASAGDEQRINEMLKAGGTVHLSSGVYNIEGPIHIPNDGTTLSGDAGTILRVSCPNGRWFSNSIGIINSRASNLEIYGFQVDGNIRSMPSSYSDSSSATSHDCGKLFILGGYSGQHAHDISLHDLTLYDAFSDGIYIRYSDNVSCYGNIISDCQHEGIFWAGVQYGWFFGNKIAGICSDGGRLDNCIDCKIFENVFVSFNGDSFGEYKHGENGLQLANGGSSHGYTTNNPMKTKNIEVYNNTFSNPGLQAIWLHGGENMFIHDNKFVDTAKLETTGLSFDINNISYTNPPTIEQSENIFGSIIDILTMNVSDYEPSQYHDQTKENISIVHENATKTIDINHLISPILVLFSGIVGVFAIAIFFTLKVII
jgi:hypothetical protein